MERRKNRMKRISSFFLVAFFLALTFLTFAESSERLTVELLFDRSFQENFSTPQLVWLNEGKILLLDSRREREARAVEILDPETKMRVEVLNTEEFREGLSNLLKKEKIPEIRWPEAVDLNGKGMLYVIESDLFLLDLKTKKFKRLTETESVEKSPAFSPDGKKISFIRDNELYVLDLLSGEEKRLTQGATDTLLNGALSWVYWEEIFDHTEVPYVWSPDSRAIAFLQTDESQVSVSTFVNFEPATQAVVYQRYPKAGQKNPVVRLGIVEVSTAEITWIDCGEYEYIVRFNWLPQGDEIALQTLNRAQSELRLLLAKRENGESKVILVERQPAWINLNDSLYFLKNGNFIWMSERDGYQHLYLYSKEGKLIRQLTKGEYMVCPSQGALVSRNGGLVGVDEKKGWVYFTSNRDALKERHLYRINLDSSGLRRLSKEEGVHGVEFSPCLRFYLDSFSSSSQPPSLTLHAADGREILALTSSAKSIIEKYNLRAPEFHTFKTEDGLELPTMMFKPQDFSPEKKYPAIVYVYGGPGAQQVLDRWRDLWNNLLSQEGFFVFVFEVRAGMGKNKELETSVYKRAYGMQNVKDILDGVRWLKSLPFIDEERLGLWGWSGGGCTTLYTMTHTDVFKAAIAVAPVSDWHYYDTIYTERYQGTPQENPEGYKETSAVLAAQKLKGKLLIVHGTYDDNVHPQNTYAFVNQLIANNIQFQMMIYPWRMHGISDTAARIHLYTLMLDFWKKNL